MVTPSTRERGKQQACTAVALGCGAFEGFSGRTRGSVRDTRSGRVGGTRGAKDASGASRALPRTREGDSGAGADRGVSRVAKINRVPQSSERVREKDVTESAKRRFLSDLALKMQSAFRTTRRSRDACTPVSRFPRFAIFTISTFSTRRKKCCWLAFVSSTLDAFFRRFRRPGRALSGLTTWTAPPPPFRTAPLPPRTRRARPPAAARAAP